MHYCQTPLRFVSSPQAAAEGGLIFCLCFLFIFFIFIFNDFYQTNYLNIYRTDLRQIFRFCRTVAVGDQSEISVSIP